MDDEKNKQARTAPSYWAVLPSPIRYNPKLSSSAKVLYAELSSLTQSYGYCWADNDYFCRLRRDEAPGDIRFEIVFLDPDQVRPDPVGGEGAALDHPAERPLADRKPRRRLSG